MGYSTCFQKLYMQRYRKIQDSQEIVVVYKSYTCKYIEGYRIEGKQCLFTKVTYTKIYMIQGKQCLLTNVTHARIHKDTGFRGNSARLQMLHGQGQQQGYKNQEKQCLLTNVTQTRIATRIQDSGEIVLACKSYTYKDIYSDTGFRENSTCVQELHIQITMVQDSWEIYICCLQAKFPSSMWEPFWCQSWILSSLLSMPGYVMIPSKSLLISE